MKNKTNWVKRKFYGQTIMENYSKISEQMNKKISIFCSKCGRPKLDDHKIKFCFDSLCKK